MYEAKVMGCIITQIIDKLNFSRVHNRKMQSVLLYQKMGLLKLILCFQSDVFWKLHFDKFPLMSLFYLG